MTFTFTIKLKFKIFPSYAFFMDELQKSFSFPLAFTTQLKTERGRKNKDRKSSLFEKILKGRGREKMERWGWNEKFMLNYSKTVDETFLKIIK